MATGDYKLIKTNSESSFDEKTIQAENNYILSFDENINPIMVSVLNKPNEPSASNRVLGTEWYCDITNRTYTWIGVWIDFHNTFKE